MPLKSPDKDLLASVENLVIVTPIETVQRMRSDLRKKAGSNCGENPVVRVVRLSIPRA